jgi:cytochrome c biogenesis factor
MEIHKIKRLVYTILSTLLYTSIILGSFYIVYDNQMGINKEFNIIGRFFSKFFILIIMLFIEFLVLIVMENKIFKEKTYSIISLMVPFIVKHKEKWAFHPELGPFLISITKNKINVYQQNYLTLIEITEFDNNNNTNETTNTIKKSLDSYFKNKLEIKKLVNLSKDKLNTLDNWDGYFDNQTRRDNKIDKLLK